MPLPVVGSLYGVLDETVQQILVLRGTRAVICRVEVFKFFLQIATHRNGGRESGLRSLNYFPTLFIRWMRMADLRRRRFRLVAFGLRYPRTPS